MHIFCIYVTVVSKKKKTVICLLYKINKFINQFVKFTAILQSIEKKAVQNYQKMNTPVKINTFFAYLISNKKKS